MGNTTETPSYIPSALLISGSPLTSEELTTQFEDFRTKLPHVVAAPELVFECVVSNLSKAFKTALEPALQQHASEIKELQSLNDELRKELKELKCTNQELVQALERESCTYSHTSIPDPPNNQPAPAVAVRTKPSPCVGRFRTNDVRFWFQIRAQTSKIISFGRPYASPPSLPMGLTELDIAHTANLRVQSYASNVHKDRFEIHIDSREDTILHGAGCSWLEIEADDPDFQCGSYSTLEDYPQDKCQAHTTREITFPRAYNTPPVVVVWLAGFDMNREKNCRIKTFAEKVTTTGFTINIAAWGDSVLYSAVSSWVAYTADIPRVCSGRFSTPGAQSQTGPRSKNSGYEKFKTGVFSTPPRTMVAIDMVDAECGRGLRLLVNSSSISAEGMEWNLDTWFFTKVYTASASYIALS